MTDNIRITTCDGIDVEQAFMLALRDATDEMRRRFDLIDPSDQTLLELTFLYYAQRVFP